jgi:hypothetical protein
MGHYFERIIAGAGCHVWHKGEALPDAVILSLDGAGREWALLREEWLATGVIVVATGAKTDSFLMIDDRDDSTQRLLRPFTPARLREALAAAEEFHRSDVTRRAHAIEEGELAATALPAIEPVDAEPIEAANTPSSAVVPEPVLTEFDPADDSPSSVDTERVSAAPIALEPAAILATDAPSPEGHPQPTLAEEFIAALNPDDLELEPEREISADVQVVEDEALMSEALEIRLAETIAVAVPGLARLDSSAARVATLRHLIQNA